MNIKTFTKTLDRDTPPDTPDKHCLALWYDAKEDWETAHKIVQNLPDSAAARIHAYLHRKEGDDWNARYWHRRAGTAFPDSMTLEEEREMLVKMVTNPK
jgi:hypothetical protein